MEPTPLICISPDAPGAPIVELTLRITSYNVCYTKLLRFIYVVYPSRQNDRVDDIEFIDATHIRAITVNAKGERLVLYT